MSLRREYVRACAVWLGTTASLFGTVRAETFTYTINQSQSQVNLTAGGTIFGGALTVTEQQANAITRYNGTIGVDVTVGGPDFVGAGSANAVNPTGGFFNSPLQYSPNVNGAAGTAPANYGLNLTAPVNVVIPTINIPPEVIAALPAPLNTLIPTTLNLGTLSSIVSKVAVRDVTLQVSSNDRIPRTGNNFDPTQTLIDITGGFADMNISARLTQPNFLQKTTLQLLLGAVASSAPQLGLTVTSPSFFSNDLDIGFGFRIDLSALAAVPNTSALPATITGLGGPPGPSTLTLPVEFTAIASIQDVLGPDLAPILGDLVNLQFDFAGRLVATSVVPEASTFVMIGLALSGAAVTMARRRSR
ncbi:hypothetical protein K2X85_06640 [bacterium]|nr:hypothetical protein [bacterium]